LKSLNLVEVPDGFPDSAAITELTTFWEERCVDGRLPARRDFPPEDLARWIGYVSLVDVDRERQDFRWRLIGTRIAKQMGRDVSGKYFAEIYGAAVLEGYQDAYMTAVNSRTPAYFRGDLEFVDRGFRHFRSVHLPLAKNGQDVDMLLLLLDFD